MEAPGPNTAGGSSPPSSSSAAANPRAVAAMIERHADALWRYALSRVRSEDLAEELVQETLVAALASGSGDSASAFEGRAADSTWLIAILRNKIADHYRRVARERGTSVASGPNPAPSPDPGIEDRRALDNLFTTSGLWTKTAKKAMRPGARAVAEISPPTEIWDRSDFLVDLQACAEKLPAGVWDAFVMREALAVESEAICQQLGITPSNLWQRLHRARAALRECLTTKGWWGR